MRMYAYLKDNFIYRCGQILDTTIEPLNIDWYMAQPQYAYKKDKKETIYVLRIGGLTKEQAMTLQNAFPEVYRTSENYSEGLNSDDHKMELGLFIEGLNYKVNIENNALVVCPGPLCDVDELIKAIQSSGLPQEMLETMRIEGKQVVNITTGSITSRDELSAALQQVLSGMSDQEVKNSQAVSTQNQGFFRASSSLSAQSDFKPSK